MGIIFIAHFFDQSGYDWTQNTISELASQDHKNKWIMQAGFIGFGLFLNAGIIIKFIAAKTVDYPNKFIMLYGLAICITGFYCTKPIAETTNHSASESRILSIFASIAGISLSLGILWYLLSSTSSFERMFHLLFLVLVMGCSMLFMLSENSVIGIGKSIVQRIL